MCVGDRGGGGAERRERDRWNTHKMMALWVKSCQGPRLETPDLEVDKESLGGSMGSYVEDLNKLNRTKENQCAFQILQSRGK